MMTATMMEAERRLRYELIGKGSKKARGVILSFPTGSGKSPR